jgi:hypothetical protein
MGKKVFECVQTLKFKLRCMKQCDDLSSLGTMYSPIFTKPYEIFLSSLYIDKMILCQFT